MEIVDVVSFRITRNADVERDEEDAEDLLEMVAEELRERRFANVVRLEHGPGRQSVHHRAFARGARPDARRRLRAQVPMEYLALGPLADVGLPALKFPPWVPVTPPALAGESSRSST